VKRFGLLIASVFIVVTLNACTPIGAVVGAGATAGVAALSERGMEATADDLAIHAKIQESWFSINHKLSTGINIVVYEGRVLLTGSVETDALRAEAIKLAWMVEGVKDVLNHILVGDDSGMVDYTNDAWISAKLKTILTFDDKVFAVNYSVETSNKVVYLMGIAQNQAELDRVIAQARDIKYVKKVVSYVRIKTNKTSDQKST
jgi:osmotically-inducible protein OsmY